MELEGSGLIENDPLFVNLDIWDFLYEANSPCIDAGNPIDTDPDGSTRDIGARWYGDEEVQPGDCNADGIQNVLDVVYLINNCIISGNDNCGCGDLNEDGIVNVLDVVILINSILEV